MHAGIWLGDSSNNSIYGNAITNNELGIVLSNSDYNTIHGNHITHNAYGIWFQMLKSSNNAISGNNITNNEWDGIHLLESSNNTISGNNVTTNNDGIYLIHSSNNIMSGNNVTTNNYSGVRLTDASDYNALSGNNLINNGYGIWIEASWNNIIYHNNFVDNSQQVYNEVLANVWDDGYPSGGNYWSDHVCVGNPSDGSQPYVIDENDIDHYPFQNPTGWLLELEGDVNGDRIVDIIDGVIIGVAFGTEPGDPKWNAIADIVSDNFIDIQDIVLWATHFGETL